MDPEKNSILIVDDEPANQQYFIDLLGEDYVCYLAVDGNEAVKKAIELNPDLILLDILIPEMNGYEVINVIKSMDNTQNIPIILMSGLTSVEDEEKGLSLNAADYIARPFSDIIIKIRVQNQMRIVNQMRAIERLSMIDQLTDIPNRRRFDQQLNMEWHRAMREQAPVSLLMIDIDRFKDYNDTYGHQQGDVVLQTVAQVLTKTLKRATDFAARWGGEEFAVLLPNARLDGALVIAEQIRLNIEETTIACPDGTHTNATVSIGICALIPSMQDSIDQFISKADKALYEAKAKGRNQVCIHEDNTN